MGTQTHISTNLVEFEFHPIFFFSTAFNQSLLSTMCITTINILKPHAFNLKF
jgi:hypothetical protein